MSPRDDKCVQRIDRKIESELIDAETRPLTSCLVRVSGFASPGCLPPPLCYPQRVGESGKSGYQTLRSGKRIAALRRGLPAEGYARRVGHAG